MLSRMGWREAIRRLLADGGTTPAIAETMTLVFSLPETVEYEYVMDT
jgi:hypothetical protein